MIFLAIQPPVIYRVSNFKLQVFAQKASCWTAESTGNSRINPYGDRSSRADRPACPISGIRPGLDPGRGVSPMIVDICLVVNEVDIHDDEFPGYP
jgi:hypothetical protein